MNYKIYIQSVNGFPISDWCCSAYLGFKERGAEIILFEDIDEVPAKPTNLVVGFVEDTLKYFEKLGIPKMDALNIPFQLQNYCGRTIEYTTIGLAKALDYYPIFVKPVITKQFVAGVLKGKEDFNYYLRDVPNETKIMVSDVVDFVSEYRCYVTKGILKGVKHYIGDFRVFPDMRVIDGCINDYLGYPAGYTIDFGVTQDGKTLLIECNDGWAIGNYGLSDNDYAGLLAARWLQIMQTKK